MTIVYNVHSSMLLSKRPCKNQELVTIMLDEMLSSSYFSPGHIDIWRLNFVTKYYTFTIVSWNKYERKKYWKQLTVFTLLYFFLHTQSYVCSLTKLIWKFRSALLCPILDWVWFPFYIVKWLNGNFFWKTYKWYSNKHNFVCAKKNTIM